MQKQTLSHHTDKPNQYKYERRSIDYTTDKLYTVDSLYSDHLGT